MDHTDQQILAILEQDARVSMTQLGKYVGLTQPAVTERVKRLEEKGVIKEFRAIISTEKIGKSATAYILFKTEKCTPFLEFCRSAPEVIECYRISGEYNYMLKVVSDSTASIEEFGNQCDLWGHYMILLVMSAPIEFSGLISSLQTENLLV